MTPRQQSGTAGFTLVELMSATTLLLVFTTAALTLTGNLFQSDQRTAAYTADVMHCRRTMDALGRDLRGAEDVAIEASTVTIATSAGPVEYRLKDRRVTRIAAGRTVVLARAVGALDVTRDGDLVRIKMTLAPRRRDTGRPQATVATTVRLRAPRSSE